MQYYTCPPSDSRGPHPVYFYALQESLQPVYPSPPVLLCLARVSAASVSLTPGTSMPCKSLCSQCIPHPVYFYALQESLQPVYPSPPVLLCLARVSAASVSLTPCTSMPCKSLCSQCIPHPVYFYALQESLQPVYPLTPAL